jgi:hypothetical protein
MKRYLSQYELVEVQQTFYKPPTTAGDRPEMTKRGPSSVRVRCPKPWQVIPHPVPPIEGLANVHLLSNGY